MERQRLLYPIGQQDFKDIRERGCVYIDKTSIIYELAIRQKYIFLSRPRRFGKSLLFSTIRYYFQGDKELFKGLAISHLEEDWTQYPVLNLELSTSRATDTDSLKTIIESQFKDWETKYNINAPYTELSPRFRDIIIGAYNKTGKKVVILVDEYDNPLINTIHHPEVYEKNRELLKSIYSNIKPLDEYIRFVMFTGVSRFSKTSIFSGLNNITDITFDRRYSTICGFTEDEIKKYLWPGVENIAEEYQSTPKDGLKLLKSYYDGYHFTKRCPDIYNPFSLLRALDTGEIKDYWFESGTPTFLAEMLKKSRQSFSSIFNARSTSSSLAETDTIFQSPVSLLYQTGYLTIKGYERDREELTDIYQLGIPNREVEKGLFNYLLKDFSGMQLDFSRDIARQMGAYLKEGAIDMFLSDLKEFMIGIPYDIIPAMNEKYFQHLMYLLLRVGGIQIEAEKRTSFGRSDIIAMTDKYIYIFELKLDGSAEAALRQIEEKNYAAPFYNDPRKLFKIGISFSSETRTIDSCLIG